MVLSVPKMTVKNHAIMRHPVDRYEEMPLLQVQFPKAVTTTIEFCETKPLCPFFVGSRPPPAPLQAIDDLGATDELIEIPGDLTNDHAEELPRVMTRAEVDRELRRPVCGSPVSGERSADTSHRPETSLEAMIELARRRAEFEKRTPFRAVRSRKPNDRARREAEAADAAEAALRFLQGECESERPVL